jgi:hypothetical protein
VLCGRDVLDLEVTNKLKNHLQKSVVSESEMCQCDQEIALQYPER